MPTIKLLSNYIINKISAGEVVERPASVVKELIENSIDAKADEIKIEVSEGGKSLIRVIDNGIGMDKDDARLCFERHATSKISEEEDLYSIRTLGFRGEALSSIAAVSKLKIMTKMEKRTIGTYVEVENSKVTAFKDIQCTNGTSIEAKSLFFNTPARKKYIKNILTELNLIIDIVTRYALINFTIQFKLVHNGKIIFTSPKTKDLLSNIAVIYGSEVAKNLIPIKHESNFALVEGFISKPNFTRNNKSMQSFYINGRYVKSSIINDAIYESYHTLLFTNKHPIAILDIKINPEEIDVNVHPSKEIVKVSKENVLKEAVSNAITNSLQTTNLVPDVSIELSERKFIKKYDLAQDRQSILIANDAPMKIKPDKKTENKIGPFFIIGQINKTYIVAENNKGLLILDQHAAQERVKYETFMRYYKEKKLKVQELINPILIELTLDKSNIIIKNIEFLKNLGFELELYGKNSFLLRTVPYIFETFDKNMFYELVEEISQINTKLLDKIKEEKIIMFACRKSIKAGKSLSNNEMEELISSLDKAESPFTCPHGRPTMINITLAELEKKFKRTC